MKIAREFRIRQAWILLQSSFFKPVSGTESANAIGDKIFTDFNAWMKDGFLSKDSVKKKSLYSTFIKLYMIQISGYASELLD